MIRITENEGLLQQRAALLSQQKIDHEELAKIEEAIAANLGIHLSRLRERQSHIETLAVREPKRRRQTYKELIVLYREAMDLAKEVSVFKKKMREVEIR